MFNKASLFSALALTASLVNARPGPAWVRRQEDAQSSLTLDPAVISQGLAQDGQGNNPDPGQVRSQTSTNNFINHCLKFLDQGVPLTDGKQITGGSCNQTPMGRIISLDKAPRSKFVFPKNGDESIVENTPFTVQMRMVNMISGNFVNAQANYYAAPQQVDGNGILIGHSHIVIEPLPAIDSTEPLDPLAFKFFKGLNDPADGQGILKTDVTAGLPKGVYRMCSINTAANHQPALVSNAQHGSLDDCVYFTIRGQGEQGNNNNGQNGQNGNGQNNGQNGQNNGQNGQNNGQNGQNNGQNGQNNGQNGQNNGQNGQNNGQNGQNNGQNGQNGNGQNGQNGNGQNGQNGQENNQNGQQGSQNGQNGQNGNGQNGQNGNGQNGQNGNNQNGQNGNEQNGQNGNGQNGQNGNVASTSTEAGSTTSSGTPPPEATQGNNSGTPTETPGSTSAPAPEASQGNNGQPGNNGQGQGNQGQPGQGEQNQGGQSPPPEQGNNGPQQGNQGPPEQTGAPGQQPPQGQGQGQGNQGSNGQPEQTGAPGEQPPQGQADPNAQPGQNGPQGPQRRRSHNGRQ